MVEVTDPFADMNAARDLRVDGAALLDEVVEVIRYFVVMPSDEAVNAMALHIAATHGQQAWEIAPRFVFKAAEKQCGKTRAQTVHRYLSHRPIATVNISAAAMVRLISEDDPPTLVMDEYDTYFGRDAQNKHEDIRGIINSGHQRGQNYTRWNMTQRELEEIHTFCMVTLAGIGSLPDTVESRSVVTEMRRRVRSENIGRFRLKRDKPRLEQLASRLHTYVQSRLRELEAAELHDFTDVGDRDAETWGPLIAVADVVGGKWPDLAREACVSLCSGRTHTTKLREHEELLRDVHRVFGDADRMSTQDLITALANLEESPWGRRDTRFGGVVEPLLTDRKVADLLGEYGVKSMTIRVGDKTLRGYHADKAPVGARSTLREAWMRNCTCDRCSGVSGR